MTEAKLTWSIWQALLNAFAWAFTRHGFHRFAEGITAMAINVEEHTITQSVLALGKVKGDSHQIWRTQRVQVNVASLRLFLRSSTGPNRAFEPQLLGRVRDPVRIAEGPTAMDAATQRRHFGFRLRL